MQRTQLHFATASWQSIRLVIGICCWPVRSLRGCACPRLPPSSVDRKTLSAPGSSSGRHSGGSRACQNLGATHRLWPNDRSSRFDRCRYRPPTALGVATFNAREFRHVRGLDVLEPLARFAEASYLLAARFRKSPMSSVRELSRSPAESHWGSRTHLSESSQFLGVQPA